MPLNWLAARCTNRGECNSHVWESYTRHTRPKLAILKRVSRGAVERSPHRSVNTPHALTHKLAAGPPLPAEDLYLSNSVFPLDITIFLERFPLERESFFSPTPRGRSTSS